MEHRTARALLAALAAREVSAEALARQAIAAIEAADPALNAVVIRDFDRALQAARAADAARARGETGALLGLPMTVKEAFNVAGLPTTWGLPGTAGIPVTEDAVMVRRLKAAGAVILGKSNVATMLGDWQSANPVYGATANPWDISRTAGGSSGGGAAAVAAGMVALEFGSDLASSLRAPAAFCGVYAHKPSWGLVPQRGLAPPGVPQGGPQPAIDLSVLGPIARSPGDLRLALQTVMGPDDAEAGAWCVALPPARATALKDFRVLILDQHPLLPTAAVIRQALADLEARLRRGGAGVSRQAEGLPDFAATAGLQMELMMAQFSADVPDAAYAAARAAAEGLEGRGDPQAASLRGQALSHRDWIRADRRRFADRAAWARVFQAFDVVLCPAMPTAAFAHDDRPMGERTLTIDGAEVPYVAQSLWGTLATVAGLPATAAPLGLTPEGLPIGMQVIGPWLEDLTPLAFAEALEQAFGGFRPPPALP